jgi:hypothetical protein
VSVSAYIEVHRDGHWYYVAQLYHWSTKRPPELCTLWGQYSIPIRGLPDNISQLVNISAQGSLETEEFMGATWTTSEELKLRLSEMAFDPDFENWIICCEGFAARNLETRIVFWIREYT